MQQRGKNMLKQPITHQNLVLLDFMDDRQKDKVLALYTSLLSSGISAQKIVELYKVVSGAPGLSQSDLVMLRSRRNEFLRDRRKTILEQIIDLDDELTIAERYLGEPPIPPQNLDALRTNGRFLLTGIQEGALLVERVDAHEQIENFIVDEEAQRLMSEKGITPWTAKKSLEIVRRSKGRLLKRSLDEILELFKSFSTFKPQDIGQYLGIGDSHEILKILSCYNGKEIIDAVLLVNPTLRGARSFYLLSNCTRLQEVLPRLGSIYDSLKEGNISYFDASRFLMNRHLPTYHELFDPIIETVFERREDGTYTKDSFELFKAKSEEYRFKEIKILFSEDAECVSRALSRLESYRGIFTITIDVTNAKSRKPSSPNVIYMFKCNHNGGVDITGLKRELGLNT